MRWREEREVFSSSNFLITFTPSAPILFPYFNKNNVNEIFKIKIRTNFHNTPRWRNVRELFDFSASHIAFAPSAPILFPYDYHLHYD